MTEDIYIEKFKIIYFKLRKKYISELLKGIDNYQSKQNAFSLITYHEKNFFFQQLRDRNLTLYDCLSLTEERLIFD